MNRFIIQFRYWLVPLLLWSGLVGGSLWWNLRAIDDHILAMATNQGRFIFQMIQTFRIWNARHGGIYVPSSEQTPSNPYLKVPDRDIATPSGVALTKLNPAYMTRQLSGIILERNKAAVHITSLTPLNPLNVADAWEARALRSFEEDVPERREVLPGDNGGEFRYMAPLVTQKPCLACHAQQGYKVGDIRGGISVSFSYTPFVQASASQHHNTLLVHLAAWLLLNATTLLFLVRVRKQLLALHHAKAEQDSLVATRTAQLDQKVQELEHTQHALAASEYRFRSVTQSAADGIIAADHNGIITFWNQAATLLFGYSEAEALGQPLTLLMPARYHQQHLNGLHRASQGLPTRHIGNTVELTGLHRDGREFPLELSLASWKVEGAYHFSAVIRDITQRKEADEAFRRSQSQYRQLLETAKFIPWEVDVVQGIFTYIGPQVETLLGYPVDEWQNLDSWSRRIHPEDRQRAVDFCLTQTQQGQDHDFEYRFLTIDNQVVWVRDVVTVITNAHNKPVTLRGFFIDITERKQVEEQLALQAAALESAANTIFITNPDGEIQWVNAAFTRQTGYTPAEAIGHNPRLLKSGQHSEAFYKQLWDTISAGRVWQGELINKRKDGSIYTEETTITPVTTPQGIITAYVTIKQDISARKESEERLRQAMRQAEAASQAKSAFLATMSHEIRTPMNAIIGMGDLLLQSGLTPQQRHHLEVSNRAGETLLTLINDILDLAKIDAGKISLEVTPFHLSTLIHEAVEILALRARDKGLELRETLHPDTPEWVAGDPVRLRQVFLNLVGNAVKFTEAGHVTISAAPGEAADTIHFTVADSGIGIPGEKLESIFQPFTQADSTTTRQYGGTGLGLNISQRLLEQMDGRIWAESTQGAGSVFHVIVPLPAVEPPAHPVTIPPMRLDRRHGSQRRKESTPTILLVEDSPDNQLLIKAYMKKEPYRLELAYNGQDALEKCSTHGYDLILMDMQMPVMDGYTATTRIREMEERLGRRRCPIVALTAHALPEDHTRSLAVGCDLHLTKPIKKTALLEVVDRLLGERGEA